jgi:hypothetical protein
MARRAFLTRIGQWAVLPFLTTVGELQGQSGHKQLKILMKSAWGSDDPTKAAFSFLASGSRRIGAGARRGNGGRQAESGGCWENVPV